MKKKRSEASFDEAALILQISRLEKVLSSGLAGYLIGDQVYSIRRILPAELENLYLGPQPGNQ